MPVIEPERAEEVIPDKHLAFDKQSKRLKQWFSKFGYEVEGDESTKFELCHTLEGESANPEEINGNNSVLDRILQRKQNQWNAKREQFRKEFYDEKERIRLEEERIIAEEEQKRKEEEEARIRAEKIAAGELDEEEAKQPEPQPEAEQQEEEKEKEPPQPPKKDNIDDEFAPVLMEIWNNIEDKYITRMRKIFDLYRSQRERVVNGFSKTQKYFVQYLNRPDKKQEMLDQFVVDFNKFSDEFPDLREDPHTKDELHQRTDTLSDKLWEISEKRRDEAIEERKTIINNGWVEFELKQMTHMAQSLMQAEIDKFRSSVFLIQDYYHAIEEKLVPDAPEKQNYSINYELVAVNEDGTTEELPPVYEISPEGDKEVYPRLAKLYERALKSQVLPEITSTPPGAGAVIDKKAKKDPKKQAEEEAPEVFFYEEEMKEAIKTEKAVLRFRLTMIRNWAINLMKEIRQRSKV
jgi:hypothetical protein